MPSSGISSFFKYKDSFSPHTLFSVQDSYYVGTHQRKNDTPIYVSAAFLERQSHSPNHAKVIVPLSAALTTTFWTLVHVVWIPHQMREIGAETAPTHVLSLPLAQFLQSLHQTPESRAANTIPIDVHGEYTNDDDRYRDGIIDTPSFRGYQLIAERFVFQTAIAAGSDSFAVQNPSLTVRASAAVVNRWRPAIQAMPANRRVPQMYGALVEQQPRLDAAGIPRIMYRSSVQVQRPGESRDQFGANLLTSFENVWPANSTFNGTVLTPAFSNSIRQSTAFFPNHPNGFLLEISLDQLETNPAGDGQ